MRTERNLKFKMKNSKLFLIFNFALLILNFSGLSLADSMVIRPNGDNGTNLWAPTPAGSHYATVDEETVSDADYVKEVTLNQKDEWDLEDVTGTIPSGSTIDSVLLTYRGKGGYSAVPFERWDKYKVGLKLDASYTWGTEHWDANFTTYTEKLGRPGGGDWSRDELDDLIISAIMSVDGDVSGVWVSWTYATVYYTPPAEAANKLLLKRQQRK